MGGKSRAIEQQAPLAQAGTSQAIFKAICHSDAHRLSSQSPRRESYTTESSAPRGSIKCACRPPL